MIDGGPGVEAGQVAGVETVPGQAGSPSACVKAPEQVALEQLHHDIENAGLDWRTAWLRFFQATGIEAVDHAKAEVLSTQIQAEAP